MNRRLYNNILARFSFNHHLKSQLSPIPTIPDGTAAGVQSPGGCAVESPIAGLAEELENTNLTSSVEPLSSAVLPAGTNLTSTDGGDDKLVEPIKMKKPWEAYPKFTVYMENENPCGTCRHNASGCRACLSPLEFKVRHTLKEKLWLQDPENRGRRLPTPKGLGQTVRFSKLADNEGTLKPDVAKMFQEACDEVRKALDADGLQDWNVKRSEMNKMMK